MWNNEQKFQECEYLCETPSIFFSFSLLPRICVGGCAVFVHMMALEHQRKTEPRSEINEGKRKAASHARARTHTQYTRASACTHTHTHNAHGQALNLHLSLPCLSILLRSYGLHRRQRGDRRCEHEEQRGEQLRSVRPRPASGTRSNLVTQITGRAARQWVR